MKKLILLSLFTIGLLQLGCQGEKPKQERQEAAPIKQQQANAAEEDWISLFNGKDLTGWIPKIKGYETGENFGNTFRVENGILKVSYDEYEEFNNRFGHLFYEKPFSYYRLKVEYRFVGEQMPDVGDWAYKNSGVMVHGQSAESMMKEQDFPISLEAQLLGGNGTDNRPTANLCTPGTEVIIDGEMAENHCISANAPTYHDSAWYAMEVLALGDSLLQHLVEGNVVIEYSKPTIGGGVVNNYDEAVKVDGTPISGGSISLQSESHPVEFRSVELLNLEGCTDPKALNYKSYYVKSANERCIYESK